nr:leucine-rich repeat protein [Candidatus Sigynarchaeum springense]
MKQLRPLPEDYSDIRTGGKAEMSVRVHGKEVFLELTWTSDRLGRYGRMDPDEDELECIRLELIGLGIERLAEVEGLDELPRLDVLSLCLNNIRALDELAGMPWAGKLEILDVQSNPLERLDGLAAACKALERLEISGGLWQDAPTPALDEFEHLTQLRLTRASSLRGIGNLPMLESLLANENCSIQRIEGLDGLPNLKNLSLAGNHIKKIEGLGGMPNLERLDLGNNRIERIEGLDRLAKLRFLFLSDNHIMQIEGLDELENLYQVILVNNPIPGIDHYKAMLRDWPADVPRSDEGYKELLERSGIHLSPAVKARWMKTLELRLYDYNQPP